MREPFHLRASTREALLATAHHAISEVVLPASRAGALVRDDERVPEDTVPAGAAGVFVSLYVGETLRGCLGTWSLDHSLSQAVRRMAEAAATRDSRFPPLTPDEVSQVSVEISVVGAPREGEGKEWRLGEQGLTIARGAARGVLLPQVALTHHLDRRAFLEATCAKAGLGPDAWKDPQTAVRAFDVEVFADAPA